MLFFHAVLTMFMLLIIYFDLSRYIIPNWICGVLVALYPAMVLLSPDAPAMNDVAWAVGIALMVFAIGAGMFVMKWIGGGDVKLLAALSLWAGSAATMELVFYTALLGGVLAVALVILRPIVGRYISPARAGAIPRALRDQEPLPYGLAICVAFLILLWTGRLAGLPV